MDQIQDKYWKIWINIGKSGMKYGFKNLFFTPDKSRV
jgi:hypothetical protein